MICIWVYPLMGLILRLAFLLAAACTASSLLAQTAKTWSGAAGADFATAAAWGGTAPTNNTTTHYALFTAGNQNQPVVSANRSIAGLEFSATATAGDIGSSNAAVLTIGSYGVRNLASNSYTMSISTAIALGTSTSYTNNGDFFMFAATALGANTLTLSGSSIFSRINGVISGTGGVIINSGTNGGWRLNNSNTYTGGTTLTGGSLMIGNNSALGSGTLTFNGGTFLADSSSTLGNAITVANTARINASTNLTLNGAATMTGARTFDISGTGRVTFNAAIGQSATGYGLTKSGVGSMVLNAASTYTGTTTITDGTLALGAAGTISGANLTLNGGVLATSGTFSRNFGTGAGQFQFGTSGGGFAAYGGALTVSVANAGTDWYGFFNGYNARFGSAVSDNVVTLTNSLNLVGGGSDYYVDVADNSSSTADKTVFSGTLSGDGNLAKTGTGQLDLTAASTRTGSTYVLGGTLRVAHATALGSGALTVQSSIVQLAADTATDFANNIQLNSGGGTLTNDRLTAGAGLTHRLGNLSLAGTLNIQKGANVTGGTATIAFDDVNGAGTFAVFGGARVELASVTGSGALTFAGSGDAEVLGSFTTGAATLTKSGTGTLTLNATSARTGSTILAGGTLVLGADQALGSGAITVGGSASTLRGVNGAHSFSNDITFNGGLTLAGSSDLTFSGATLHASNNTWVITNTGTTTFTGAMALSNSATNRTLTIDNSGNAVLSGAIANGSTSTAGALIKNGTGTLTLAGANTYAGNTTINAGTLNLTGSIANSALTNIAAGATLTGAGSLGDLMLAGTYSPGNSPALVSLGDFTMGGTGLLQMEIGGLTRGTGYDALDINGIFATGGTLDVTFINGFTPTGAATFNLFDFTSATGTFSTINLPTLASGYAWDTSGLYTTGELTLTAAAVPEPSTYALLAGLGVLSMAAWRRRRLRSALKA